MSKKTNIEDIKNTVKEKGYIILSDNIIYKNNKQKIDFIDKDGFLYNVSYNNLCKTKILDKYGKLNPYHIYNLNNFIKINKLKIKFADKDFLGTKQKVKFICSCGNEFYTTVNEFLYNNKNCCNECSKKEKWNINKINKYLKDNDINLTLLSSVYINIDELLDWKCKCRKVFKRSWKHIKDGFTQCKDCSNKSKSSLEKYVENELIKHKINYSTQYKFDDCKNIKILSFDFAIFDNKEEISLLIEVDGIQHFKSVGYFGGEETFQKNK